MRAETTLDDRGQSSTTSTIRSIDESLENGASALSPFSPTTALKSAIRSSRRPPQSSPPPKSTAKTVHWNSLSPRPLQTDKNRTRDLEDTDTDWDDDFSPPQAKKRSRQSTLSDETVRSRPQTRSTRINEGRVTRTAGEAGKEVQIEEEVNEVEDEDEERDNNEEEDEKVEEEVQDENEDDEEEQAKSIEVLKEAQYKIKPAHIPSWEGSGQDLNIGVIVPTQSYDEDDPALGDQRPSGDQDQALENDKQQLDDEGCVTASIEADPEDLEQEERLRNMKKAKQELQKILEQMDENLIKKAYRFFKHDENKTSINIEDRIHQDGAVRPYQQHQAYAIFLIMWFERHGTKEQGSPPLGGGILGDEPGFGKVSFASFLLCGLLFI
jgi:hypothetical protein